MVSYRKLFNNLLTDPVTTTYFSINPFYIKKGQTRGCPFLKIYFTFWKFFENLDNPELKKIILGY